MLQTPRVSIILPVFNRLQFLPAAVASVSAQTFRDWELVIADDGSDAATRSYLRSLARLERIRVLWLAHCGRPAAVRNAALRAAVGTYVAFLDSDDVWAPQKLELQLRSLASRPACGWSYTAFIAVDESLTPLARGSPPAVLRGGSILDRLVTMEATIALPSVIAARELIARVGGFDERFRMCEDYDLWLRLAAVSEVDCLDEPLLWVRRHREHSGDDITAFEDMHRVLEKLSLGGSARRLDAAVGHRRAMVAAGLAASHAASGERLATLHTLASSAAYSWTHRAWWQLGLAATARAFVPAGIRRLLRAHMRSALRSRRGIA